MSALATLARNEPTQEGARPPATVRPRAEPAKAAPGSDDHGPPVALRAADGADRDPAGGHDAPPPARGGHRKSLLIALAALAALAAGGRWGWQYWTVDRFVESTDNAYVKADIVAVAPRVAGQVVEVAVDDNQAVRAGDLLLRIDDRTFRADLQQADADVAVVRAGLLNVDERTALQRTRIDVARADLRSARTDLTFAQADFERYQSLASSGAGSRQRAQETRSTLDRAGAAVARAEAQVASEERQLDVLASERGQGLADLERAEAARGRAAIDLADTVVRAPRDATVGNRGIRPGAYAKVGQTLMSLVPLREVYVVANFKETQVQGFRVGQPAKVEVDLLGGREIEGRIDSLAPASGAEFSVLPPDNATGNFTKIVQRIPVKIRLSVPDDLVGSLRPGASAVASISSRDEGRQPGAAASDAPLIGHSDQGGGRQARLVPALPSPARP